jgi:hypothetical protein
LLGRTPLGGLSVLGGKKSGFTAEGAESAERSSTTVKEYWPQKGTKNAKSAAIEDIFFAPLAPFCGYAFFLSGEQVVTGEYNGSEKSEKSEKGMSPIMEELGLDRTPSITSGSSLPWPWMSLAGSRPIHRFAVGIKRAGFGQRFPVLDHPANMQFDGFVHVLLDLLDRAAGGDATGQVRAVGRQIVRAFFDHNGKPEHH